MLNCCILALMLAQFAPSNTGELRVTVSDPSGLPIQSSVELVSQANQVHRALQTNAHGQAIARQLPFGTYEIQVTREGFAPFSGLVEIRSATPTPFAVTLGLAVLQSQVNVSVAMGQKDLAPELGFVNQTAIPKHYAMADVFVLPSTYEPRGAVINEAMACGLPVVVTDRCGSIGDIVLDGDNAFVYPAGDANALAALMDRMTADAALRARMGRRSREIISSWDFARGVQRSGGTD